MSNKESKNSQQHKDNKKKDADERSSASKRKFKREVQEEETLQELKDFLKGF